MLGSQEGAVRGNRRQHDLDHRIIHLSDDLRNGHTNRRPNQRANADDLDEIQDQSTGRHDRPCDERNAERKEDNGSAIVEQALTFEQHR